MPDDRVTDDAAGDDGATTTDTSTTTDPPQAAQDDIDWKAMSRKHERAAKEARAEVERLRTAQMTDTEKAIEEAKAAGRAEAMSETAKVLAHASFRSAAADAGVRVSDIIDLIDVSKFIGDDFEVDSDGIAAAVAKFAAMAPSTAPGAPAAPTGGPQNPPGTITREQLRAMRPEDIERARAAGELDHLLNPR